MTKKSLALIVSTSFLTLSCLCGSDESISETETLLKGLAEAAQASEQNQAEAQKQAEEMAEAMRKQMEAEMKGEKPATDPAAQPAAASTDPNAIGVPECDEYLKKYPACLESKVPAMAKDQMMMGFNATKDAWKQMAATPGGKKSLVSTCQMAMSQAKTAMKIYGCEF